MNMNGFWWMWMKIWCICVALFGIVIAGGALDATSAPLRPFFTLLGNPAPPGFDAHLRFSLGVLGPITCGWSLTLYAAMTAARQLPPAPARQIWLLITLSVLLWFVTDSTLSVYTGFGRNVIPNTVFLATFLAPVVQCGVLRRV